MVVPTTYKERLIMFDWFRNLFGRREYSTWKDVPAWDKVNDDMEKVGNDMSKVIQFPELKTVPAPEPEPEKPGRVFYRLGLTDNNRVAISMYYGEITMNSTAVQSMIDQLEFYKGQLKEDEDE
jgi:hypothetical protein